MKIGTIITAVLVLFVMCTTAFGIIISKVSNQVNSEVTVGRPIEIYFENLGDNVSVVDENGVLSISTVAYGGDHHRLVLSFNNRANNDIRGNVWMNISNPEGISSTNEITMDFHVDWDCTGETQKNADGSEWTFPVPYVLVDANTLSWNATASFAAQHKACFPIDINIAPGAVGNYTWKIWVSTD